VKLAALPFALLALMQPAPAPAPSPADAPTAAERLQWNARERTAAGKSALEAGKGPQAIPAFDTALRLAPANPTARFNAGTARLDGDAASALPLLEQAAKRAPPELAPSAWYNLGNGRLATGDAQGAVAAYIEALRRQPEHANAKVNLELALRELERQRQQQQQQQDEKQQQKENQQQPSNASSGSKNPSDQSPQPPAVEAQQPQPSQLPSSSTGSSSNPSPQGQQSPPQFHDLPDMTAEQAAAILRAVENLERQQRRERAEKQAAAKTQVEIDW
jgi:Ca-activated chloride channel family protein